MMAVVVATAFWSRSNNLRIAALIILIDWLLSNFLTTNFGSSAVIYIAPMTAVFFCILLYLYNDKKFKGRSYYRPILFFYFLYLVIHFWHMGGRLFYPETLSANYYFVLYFSNVVFILLSLTLVGLSLLKGIGNRTEGGLMAVYEKWRSKIKRISAKDRK
jgi:hypothetical protein